jgi:uncharacterized cupin superfamily protein
MCVHDDGTEILAEAGDAYYFARGMTVGLWVMKQ